jgi:hypothetical protein
LGAACKAINGLSRVAQNSESATRVIGRSHERQESYDEFTPNAGEILELVHNQVTTITYQLANVSSPRAGDQVGQLGNILIVFAGEKQGGRFAQQAEQAKRPGVERPDRNMPEFLHRLRIGLAEFAKSAS